MIGRLRGLILERGHDAIVIEVGGVGYVVAVTPRTLSDLPGLGQEVVLHTHLHVREDQLALFGFDSAPDKELFSLLLGVSGVGPKLAMAILATMTHEQLRIAVTTDDIAALTAVPGIGKRSAQKLLLELKPRLDVLDGPSIATGPLGEVREALEGLGYSAEEIRGTLAEMPEDLPVEEMVKRSLQQLGKAGA
ncbi:MAG: Holliday junction branch migration protein RuvA [Actinomycetota bacterium]|nr:Holliday junction branch migration protein RuvA [Actinomycetota bacterium]MDK1016749.1 Holliday junction branch migration protein RuvA [Actinomycetota bacterium]MDK1026415.1 Holliday junction branch migration protein RuvA [Actinomycetota bacterium]MDK1037565.1 Holliday junction branch migration protein RuvA [Actinomycetota bacterium]MDK1097389.1 Holliday junction branch migration protein RuvA [Actinomycetota bacterium]